MGFLSDYVYYSSGNEAPEEYIRWGGLSILGHILGNKCWVSHGDYFKFHPNIYPVLVGTAGSGKNTALSVNIDIMRKHFPHLLLSSSIQSREDIVFQMTEEGPPATKTWRDDAGVIQDYRPFYLLNNELNNLLSVDKIKMIDFLVEVFDGKYFSTGFKKDRQANPKRQQGFTNPHISVLAGATPEWFMNNLKLDLFSGGLGRRLLIVYAEKNKIIPIPRKPLGADDAFNRVVAHLKKADIVAGPCVLNKHALDWWIKWYQENNDKKINDPILKQFKETKGMQVLKVALILMKTEDVEGREIDVPHLEGALAMIDMLEPNVLRLTSGIGRNELAGVGAQLIDFITRTGGIQSERNILIQFRRWAREAEFQEIIRDFQRTGELTLIRLSPKGVEKTYYCTPEGMKTIESMNKNKIPFTEERIDASKPESL